MHKPAQAKEKSPLGGEGDSSGKEDCLERSGEDFTPGENESVDGLAANGKPLLRYLKDVLLTQTPSKLRDEQILKLSICSRLNSS